MARENRGLKQAVCAPATAAELVGNSPDLRTLRAQIQSFAQLDTTILITGAAGTGGVELAGMPPADIERLAVIETLWACGGNKVKTARTLGISEKTIYNKIKQYNLSGII